MAKVSETTGTETSGKSCRSLSEAFPKNRFVALLPPLSAGRAGSDAEAEAAESLTPGTLFSWDGRRAGDEQPAKASRSGSATTVQHAFIVRKPRADSSQIRSPQAKRDTKAAGGQSGLAQ